MKTRPTIDPIHVLTLVGTLFLGVAAAGVVQAAATSVILLVLAPLSIRHVAVVRRH